MIRSTTTNGIKASVIAVFAVAVLAMIALPAGSASAQTYYYPPTGYQYQPQSVVPSVYGQGGTQMTETQLIAFLQQLIVQLQAQIAAKKGTYPYNTNFFGYGYEHDFKYVIGDPRGSDDDDDDFDEEPDVETEDASDIDESSARLEGSVDMNDFEDGEVFFVYGQDEDQIEDVEDDYDTYGDVDEDGEDLQKVRVDSSLDDDEDYDYRVTGLDEDTDYFFQICVGYEDEDDDDVIACGGVQEFTTDDE